MGLAAIYMSNTLVGCSYARARELILQAAEMLGAPQPICGATWPEDPNLVCTRPAGHRGGHSYNDPPIGSGDE